MIVRATCFLCGRKLKPISFDRQQHPKADDCLVRVTDSFGIATKDIPTVKVDVPIDDDDPGDIRMFPFVEEVLDQIFKDAGVKRLGGVSSGRGWSSISTFQRCPYLWKRRYIDPLRATFLPGIEPPARAIGTLIHTFLAILYYRMQIEDYPLMGEFVRGELLKKANPDFVHEAWRVYTSYTWFYQGENIQPLAVEYDLKDPRSGESCRYDLIAFFPEAISDRPSGTWIVEHKSSDRFDDVTLNGWANEGEILGQVMLWERLGLDLRFGTLQGVIVNILGKQKEPKFHRTTVAPQSWQKGQHASDLKEWEAKIHTAIATDRFPRSRAGCIGRFGKCDLFDYCASEGL
jgi:hypothetical protein